MKWGLIAVLAVMCGSPRIAEASECEFFILPSVRVGGAAPVTDAGLPTWELAWTIPVGCLVSPVSRSDPLSVRDWFGGVSLDLSYAHGIGSGEQRDMWNIGIGAGVRWLLGGEIFGAALAGTLGGAGAFGGRVGGRVTFGWGLIGTEVSYDVFGSSVHTVQEVRVLAFLDVALALIGIVELLTPSPCQEYASFHHLVDAHLNSCPSSGCVDLRSDVHNCGSCGHVCAVGDACIARQCSPSPASSSAAP